MLANAEDGSWCHGQEDGDAAPSTEVPMPDCKKPTCIHIDETAGKHRVRSCCNTTPASCSCKMLSRLHPWSKPCVYSSNHSTSVKHNAAAQQRVSFIAHSSTRHQARHVHGRVSVRLLPHPHGCQDYCTGFCHLLNHPCHP